MGEHNLIIFSFFILFFFQTSDAFSVDFAPRLRFTNTPFDFYFANLQNSLVDFSPQLRSLQREAYQLLNDVYCMRNYPNPYLLEGTDNEGDTFRDISTWEEDQHYIWNSNYMKRKQAFEEKERLARERHLAQVRSEKSRLQRLEEHFKRQKQIEETRRLRTEEENNRRLEEERQLELIKREKENELRREERERQIQFEKAEDKRKMEELQRKEEARREEQASIKKEQLQDGMKAQQSINTGEIVDIVSIHIPGHTARDIYVKTVDDTIVIKGFQKSPSGLNKRVNTFYKTIPLPNNIEPKSISGTVDTRGYLNVKGRLGYDPVEQDDGPLIETLFGNESEASHIATGINKGPISDNIDIDREYYDDNIAIDIEI